MSPLLRSQSEVRIWNKWVGECVGVWTSWVVWECEDWNFGDGNSLLRRSLWTQEASSLSYTFTTRRLPAFRGRKAHGSSFGLAQAHTKKGMQRGNTAPGKCSRQQDLESGMQCSHSSLRREHSRWNCLIQGNIWFLSHIDSLERIVSRAWRQRNKRKGQERESQEAVHKFPKILPEALNRWWQKVKLNKTFQNTESNSIIL